MFEQIKTSLTEYQQTKKQSKKGIIIQNLKSLQYFEEQISYFGVDIMQNYLMILQPYILRQGIFIIVEGCAQLKINGLIPIIQNFKQGMFIQIPSDKNGCITALTDTKFLKLLKSKQSNTKLFLQLSKKQKQRIGRNRQYNKVIKQNKSLIQCKQFLQKSQIFMKLVQSKYLTLLKGSNTHNPNKFVDSLGFVLSGKIKVTHENGFVQGQKNVSKYYTHKKKNSNNNHVSYFQSGQCIGLEEYLWETKFKSTGQVISHDAKILYVPQPIFSSKFNQTVNYGFISQLHGLVNAKKNIKDKSITSKKQKQIQMMYQINQQLAKKRILKLYNKSKQDKSIKMRFKKDKSPIFPKQCYMPQRLTHKVKVYQQKYNSLPKIVDRINLFPQQYQKASIPIQFQEQLKKVDKDRYKNKIKNQKIILSPRSNSGSKKPDQILQRILDTITSNPEYQKTQFSKTKSRELLDNNENSTKYHFNRSIFNNFRAPKIKGARMLESLYRTLEIS